MKYIQMRREYQWQVAVDGFAQGLRVWLNMIPCTLERLGICDRLYTALLCAAQVEIQAHGATNEQFGLQSCKGDLGLG